MKVLKIVAEGDVTSFRYPHFMQQIHPTYEMPPPATIYGLICSTLGEWIAPNGVGFAYHFSYAAKAVDLEHIIVLSPSGGKLKGTTIPKIQEGNVTPFQRELLFQPRLTLYINRPDWLEAFQSPHYAVVLGRSQDLFTYTQLSVVELEQAEQAYFEHTLAPHEMALQFGRGITVLMPRYLDYSNNRAPTFQRYSMLQERVFLPNTDIFSFSHIQYGPYWIDPTSPVQKGLHLGLNFLTFVEEG
ncbi:MAG: CRISPR-associated protein Cas5 [Caldilineaceae bacterium]|nr:CRISPR-associated protein Cas5 [Caldilineaceae bacterium]